MTNNSSIKLTTILIGILVVLVSTIAVAAVFSDTVNADDDEIVFSDSDNTIETLRIINYNFSTREVPEGSDAKLRVVLQNTGANAVSGNLALNSSPVGTGPASVTLEPSSVEYNIEPGSRQTFVFDIEADDNGLDTRQTVDLSFQINPDSGDSITVDDPDDTPEDPLSVNVLPRGSSVSEGTIEPTGERQTIRKSFTSFKDNGSGNLGSYTNTIPPTAISGDEFTNTAQGRVFNFLDSTSSGDGTYTRIESSTDGNINVGLASRNIPDSEYYTLQFRYNFQTDPLSEVRVNIVSQDGTEIDRDTKYVLSEASTSANQTRYFQLSQEEANWIRENNSVFITIENTNLNSNNQVLALNFTQVLSSDVPLETTSSNIQVQSSQILNSDGNVVGTNPSFAPEDIYQIEYTVKNTGDSTGTKVITLNEGGTSIKQKPITLNPGETGTVTFSVNRSDSGVYRYSDPSGGLSDNIDVYVEGEDTIPPIAKITLPPDEEYPGQTLATDPDNPRTMSLTASESLAPNSSITEYEWTFGWLENSVTTTNPTIDVQSPSTKGDYNITLTVTNEDGQTDIDQEVLRAGTIGPVADSADDITVGLGEEFLLNGSGSSHPVQIIDSRCITEYRWELSDGTVIHTNSGTCTNQPDPTASHVFDNSGTYSINLIVEDDQGNTDSSLRQVQVDVPAPNAAITVDKSEGLVEGTFTFDASNSSANEGTIEEYQWSMGDGTTFTTTDPTLEYSYESSGVYNAEVTVVNDQGGTETASTNVNVLEQPFTIGIDGPVEGDTSDTFTFSNGPTEGRENVQEWTWTMGDGTTYENNDVVSHQFDSSGTYEVTLEGSTDEYGGFTNSKTITVDVSRSDPVANFSSSYETEMYISDRVTFDATESYDPNGTALDFTMSLSNSNETFNTDYKTDYLYPSPGTQTSTVVVTNQYGATDEAEITVDVINRGPVFDGTLTNDGDGTTYDITGDETITIYENTEATIDFSDSYHRESRGELSYEWDNGSTTLTSNTDSITTQWDEPGTYSNTARVRDQWDATDREQFTVVVEATDPVADLQGPNSSYTSETITLDPSGSYVTNNASEIVDYSWNFGNGVTRSTTNAETQNITYNSAGSYEVTLVVTDNNGRTDTTTHTVNVTDTQPVADINSQDSNKIEETFTFDGSGSYVQNNASTIQSYDWDLGDGTTATGESVDHSYSSTGTYTVSLTVTDEYGQTSTTTKTVDVTGTQPVAVISGPNNSNMGDTVSFDGSGSYVQNNASTIQSYDWSLGDGSTASGQSINHSYTNAGTYTVSLTVTDEYGYTDSTTQTIDVSRSTTVIGETGSINVDANSSNDWRTLNFDNNYDNPVVIMKPLSYNGGQPAHIRLSNPSGNSIDYKIEEWNYLNGPHTSETVHYIVVEEGKWEMSDGTKIEAGKVNANHNWSDVSLDSFNSTPVVFTKSQTYNGGAPIVTRNQYVSSNGFDTKVEESEGANNSDHATESVGYIGISQGSGTTENGINFEANSLCNCFTDNWRQINFNGNYGAGRTVVIDQQTEEGGDTAGMRFRNFYSGSVDVKIEEEESSDTETGHTSEEVGYWVFDSNGDIEALEPNTEQVRKEVRYDTSQVPTLNHDSNGATLKGDEAWDTDQDYNAPGQTLRYYYDTQPSAITWEFDMTYTTFTSNQSAADRGNRPAIQIENGSGTTIFQIWRNRGNIYFLEEPGSYNDVRDNYTKIGNISTNTTKRIKIAYNEFGNNEYRIYIDGNYAITVGDNRATNSMNDKPYVFQFRGRDVTAYDGDEKTTFNIDYISDTFNEYEP